MNATGALGLDGGTVVGLDAGTLVGIASLLGLVVTPLVAWLLNRRKDTASESRLNHDELQEDLKSLREEMRLFRRETAAKVAYQGAVIRHLDNEVIEIRRGVETGAVPPLPPRPPWPSEIVGA